ncbi:phospholipase A2 inhibitor gamma subunit B-like [Carettochelys insculpta]|uniref:phospholipase A2 inhibitor gamma subunit B-like n=1 Tax=Carettochelys insculpta TaxID=44489 RepID=UPI003EBE0DC9
MKAYSAICILAALLATGACLQCEVCSGTGHNCTGSMQPCAAGEDSCGIMVTELTVAGIKTQTILKGCTTTSLCGSGLLSMSFGNGMMRSGVACCVGDACRTVSVTVPPADSTPNGRRCRGCFALVFEKCNEETINCAGAETQCIEAEGTVEMGGSPVQTILKGCAAESICAHLKVGSGTSIGVNATLTTVKCTAASGETNTLEEADEECKRSRSQSGVLQCHNQKFRGSAQNLATYKKPTQKRQDLSHQLRLDSRLSVPSSFW